MEIFLMITFLVLFPLAIFGLISVGRIGTTQAWRSLHATVIFLVFAMMAIFYLGSVAGNEKMSDVVDDVWSWSPLFGGRGMSVGGSGTLQEHILIYWFLTCPVFVSISILLSAVEYLDAKSGLELLERLKKLIWK